MGIFICWADYKFETVFRRWCGGGCGVNIFSAVRYYGLETRRVDNYDEEEIVDPLTQLAIIATGPHSPLLHNNLALTAYQRYSLYTVYMS